MIYFNLFIGFLKVGLFSFGGAYGAIPLIRDVVSSYGWMNDEAITYMIGVSESTPGPIMVNMATYIGNSQGGILGAGIATLAVTLPAFFIILLVMFLLQNFINNKYVQAALNGLKPCIIGIILAMGCYIAAQNCITATDKHSLDGRAFLLTVVIGCLYIGAKKIRKRGMSPLTLIAVSSVLGILVYGL